MSDANRIAIGYKEESTYGVFPAGNLQELRITSESFEANTDYQFSNELRADRQRADSIRQNFSSAGGINLELSYGTFDDFLQWLLYSAGWSMEVNESVSVTFEDIATSSSNFPKVLRAAGSFITDGYVANQILRIEGAGTSANDVYAKIISVIAGEMELLPYNDSGDLTLDGTPASTTLRMGSQIVNGITQTSVSIERKYDDLSNQAARYSGLIPDTFALSVNTDGILTGSVGFIGRSEASTGTPATYDPTTTTQVFNAVDHVKAVLEGGANKGVTSLAINLANNHRPRRQVGTLGAISVGTGTIDVTGSLQAYFENSTIIDKYLSDTPSDTGMVIEDAAVGAAGFGNAYVFDIPQLKYNSGRRVGGGINTDILEDLQWSAYRDPSELITLRIARFAAA